MPNHNQVVLTGHIVRRPELSYSDKGTAYTNLTIAVGRDYGDDTDFINCVAFNRGNFKLAEYIADNVTKGKLVTIIGKLQIDQYEKEGQKHYPAKVIIDKCIYEKPKQQGSKPKQEKSDEPEEEFDPENFDVPF